MPEKSFRPSRLSQIKSEKLPLSQKLSYFRGSRVSQCVLSTALTCSLPLPSSLICYAYFEELPNMSSAFKGREEMHVNHMLQGTQGLEIVNIEIRSHHPASEL